MTHYINLFNKTDAVLNGQMPMYTIFMSLELVIMAIASLIVVVIIYLNIVTKLYHRNMRLIYTFYISTYLMHNIGNATQLLIAIFGGLDGPNLIFELSSYIRVMTIFCGKLSPSTSHNVLLAVLILPAFVVERICATYFIHDYEVNQRPLIGRLIVFVNSVTAVCLGFLFQSDRPIRYYVIVFVCLNAVAHAVNIRLGQINRAYHSHCQRGDSVYSLGQRFQIVENINSAKLWSKVAISIAFFNVVCVSALLVDDFCFSAYLKNIAVVVFNYCIHCYATTLCIVTYWCNKPWQTRLYKLLKKTRVEPIELSLRNSFGEQMAVRQEQQSNTYFDLLRKDWQ